MEEKTKNTILYLFTANYPYGEGEDYIHNELKVISSKFDDIYIFPAETKSTIRKCESNVHVISYSGFLIQKRFSILLRNLPVISHLLFTEIKNNNSRFSILRNIKYYLDVAISYIHKYRFLETHLKVDLLKDSVFYSFWMYDWATVLSIAKWKKRIPGFICRVNGFDFREQLAPNGFIFPRQFQLRYVDKVFAVSKYGYNEISLNYPSFKSKFFISKLGVLDNGINPQKTNDFFTIVSCSLMSNIKRVELIPEILKSIKRRIHWIHFGDGDCYDKVQEACLSLPINITYDLKGYTNNEDVISFYKNEHVDLFIQLSTTEGGVPVALQEAASFGIPMLATNVGGIPEIVNRETGILIPANFEEKEVANQIEANMEEFSDKRNHARNLFLTSYNAVTNYENFISQLNI